MEENQNNGENNVHVFGASSGSRPESTTTSGPRTFGAASGPKSEDEAKYGPGASQTASGPKPEGGTTSGPRTFGSSQEGGTTSGPRVFGAGSEGGQEKPRASRRIVIGDVEGPRSDYGYQPPRSFVEILDSFTALLSRPFDLIFDFLEKSNCEKVIKTVFDYMERFTIIIIILSGIWYTIRGIDQSRNQLFFDFRLPMIAFIIGAPFLTILSAVLAPKTLKLARSTQDNNTIILIRPEYLYIIKVLLVILIVFFFFSGIGILLLPIALVLLCVFCKPQLVGVKAGSPSNAVVELMALILLPYRVVMFMLSPSTVIVAIICFVLGIYFNSLNLLGLAISIPFSLPLLAYSFYLFSVFLAEFFQAICCIPSKIDKVHETISAQKQQGEESEEQQA